MIKLPFVLLVIFFSLSLEAETFQVRDSEKTVGGHVTVRSFMSRYSQDRLVNHLRSFISCCRPSRYVGSEGHSRVATYLKETINKVDKSESSQLKIEKFELDIDYAISFYEEDFEKNIASNYDSESEEYKKWRSFHDQRIKLLNDLRGFKGQNIIWEKAGSDEDAPVLIFGAHFDTIVYDYDEMKIPTDSQMPGADKNASGVTALLGLIEVISQMETKRPVRVVFFDAQEYAGLGARNYVENHKESLEQNSLGYVDVMMIAHDTQMFDSENRIGNFKAYIRSRSDDSYESDLELANYVTNQANNARSGVRFEIDPTNFDGGAHKHFWDSGISAVSLTQNRETDLNERYHTENDFVETLNLQSFYNAFLAISSIAIGHAFELSN